MHFSSTVSSSLKQILQSPQRIFSERTKEKGRKFKACLINGRLGRGRDKTENKIGKGSQSLVAYKQLVVIKKPSIEIKSIIQSSPSLERHITHIHTQTHMHTHIHKHMTRMPLLQNQCIALGVLQKLGNLECLELIFYKTKGGQNIPLVLLVVGQIRKKKQRPGDRITYEKLAWSQQVLGC